MAIKLYFAVVDMSGNPCMAQVERPEDCYEEDAYVCLADYDVQTARIKELEAEREHDALAIADLVTELQNVLPAVKVLKVRCEALEAACRRQVENIERWIQSGEPAGPEESKAIYEQLKAALRAVEG